MSRDPMPGLTVIAVDCGIDACWVQNGEGGVLVINPHQTFESAVSAVTRAAPGVSPDQAACIVREHLPLRQIDLDVLLPGYSTRWIAEHEQRENKHTRMILSIVLALVALVVGVIVAILLAASPIDLPGLSALL